MITTLFLLLLIGFQLWYMTSQKSGSTAPAYVRTIVENRQTARLIGAGLVLLATVLFIVRLGIMSGLSAAIVGLMGIGCLVVLLRPFRYLNAKSVVALYAVFVALEIFI